MAKKQRFTRAQQKAYWIGVGISNAIHDKADILDHADPAIRASVRAGYQANNATDVSHKFSKRPSRSKPAKKPSVKRPTAKKPSTKKPAAKKAATKRAAPRRVVRPEDDFIWGSNGIQGSYTVDGFFEPD